MQFLFLKLVQDSNAAGQTVQGAIKSVNINQVGIGYGVSTTSITVEPAGSGAVFNVNLQSWRINEFAKNLTNITEDDVFISPELIFKMNFSVHMYMHQEV